jgi:hypothetical protein
LARLAVVPRPEQEAKAPTLLGVSDYADPDLETVAPLPPGPPPVNPQWVPAPSGRGPLFAFGAALVAVSLIIGFGVATLVLNARDNGVSQSASGFPSPTVPPTAVPGATTPTTTPGPTVPPDPDERALGSLILRQSDVHAGNTVALLEHGADLTVPTLDLCYGTFASEARRTARRQVALFDDQQTEQLSTEAVLYGAPANGTQAFTELRSVAAHCPATPVTSPVGEGTAITRFRAAPDGAWPRTRSVERLAYDFDTTDSATGIPTHSIAVYLRRGRALMGVYFAAPDSPQIAVAGKTTIAGIVSVFEARMARLPASVVNG